MIRKQIASLFHPGLKKQVALLRLAVSLALILQIVSLGLPILPSIDSSASYENIPSGLLFEAPPHESFLHTLKSLPWGTGLALAHSSGITLTKSVPATVYTNNKSFNYGLSINASGHVISTTGIFATDTTVTDTVPSGQTLQGYLANASWWGTSTGNQAIFKLLSGTETGNVSVGNVTIGLDLPIVDRTVLSYPELCFAGFVDGIYQSFCENQTLTTTVRSPAFSFQQAPDTACAGSTITYTLTVSNTGGARTTEVFTMAAQLDSNVTYVPGSASNSGSFSVDTITWEIDALLLANGANTLARTFQVNIPQSMADEDVVTHVYTVTSPEVTPNSGGAVEISIEKVSAVFTDTGPVCIGTPVYFANTEGSVPATESMWDFGDGTIPVYDVSSPSHSYANPGTYEVSLTVTGTCGSTLQTDVYTSQVSVENVESTFDMSSQWACAGETVSFTNTSIISGTAASWLWDFGDGNSDSVNRDSTTHLYNEPGDYIISFTVTNTLGCSDQSTDSIAIEDVEASFEMAPDPICLYETVQFTSTSAISGTAAAYMWDYGDGNTETGSTLSQTNHLYTSPGDYVVSLYVTSTHGCSDWITRPLSVGNVSVSFNVLENPTCVDEPVQFSSTSTLSGTVAAYTWDFGDGYAITGTDLATASYTYTVAGEYTATLYVTTTAGCSDWATSIITVEQVSASFDLVPDPVCVGETVFLTSTSTYSGTVLAYKWDYGDGSKPDKGSSYTNTQHIYATPGEYTVTLSVINNTMCMDTAWYTVTVQGMDVSFDVAPNPVCIGEAVYFTSTSTLSGTVAAQSWDFGDESSGSGSSTSHAYAVPGEYLVTHYVTNSLGCSDWATGTIHVENAAASFINAPSPVCLGETIYFTDTSAISGTIAVYLWEYGDGETGSGAQSSHAYSTPGDYDVTLYLTTTAGCTDSVTGTVSVQNVEAVFDAAPDPICINETVSFTSTSSYSGTISAYLWDYGDGSTGSGPESDHAYDTPGDYTVKFYMTSSIGCHDSTTGTVSVQGVAASFNSVPNPVCVGNTVYFTSTSVYSGTVSAYSWEYGDGNSGSGAYSNHTYGIPGDYIVTLYVTSSLGCTDWTTTTVSVETVTADFDSNPNPVCVGETVYFSSTSTYTGTISGYLWDYGDGNAGSDTHSQHAYGTPGDYIATLYVTTTAGCADSMTETIRVEAVDASFENWPSPPHVCLGETLYFTSTGEMSGTVAARIWDYDDGHYGYGTTVNHRYSVPGEYKVTYYVVNTAGCTDILTKTVTVETLDVDFRADTPVCLGNGVAFTNLSIITPTSSVAGYLWDFGNGDVITNVWAGLLYTGYTAANTYTATLTVTTTAGCTESTQHQVEILASPSPTFTTDAPTCANEALHFTNTTTGSGNSYLWDFDDGTRSSQSNPEHLYTSAGTYTVTLTVTGTTGCTADLQQQITILELPEPDFSFRSPICAGETVTFTITSAPNSGDLYLWQFSDGGSSTLTDTVYSFASAGTYSVTLTVTNVAGCSGSKIKPFSVSGEPTALFTSNSPVCTGETITFSNHSVDGSDYLWDFGDGQTSTETTPIHLYGAAASYTVALTVTSDCGTHFTRTAVTVSDLPQPIIKYSPTAVDVSDEITFTDTGTGGVEWWWSFEDGQTAYGQLVTHTYSSADSYTVTLVTTNTQGCAASTHTTVNVGGGGNEKYTYLPAIYKDYAPPTEKVNLVIDSINWLINGQISANPPNNGQLYHVQTIIRNEGPDSVTTDFWVDLYLNPSRTPAAGDLWYNLSQSGTCPEGENCYGRAWLVTKILGSGETVTLRTSDPLDPRYSRWASGGVAYNAATHPPIVAFVDSWPGPIGEVIETSENDNLSGQLSGLKASAVWLGSPVLRTQYPGGQRPTLNETR